MLNAVRGRISSVDRIGLAVLAVVVLGWMAWVAGQLDVASQDARMAGVFVADEETISNAIERMFTGGTLEYRLYIYPGAYLNLGAIISVVLRPFGVSEHAAYVLAPRIVSWLFGAVALALTGWLARMVSRSWVVAVASVSMLATVHDFQRFAVLVHPDTMQLTFLILAAIFFLQHATAGDRRWLWLGAAAAGAAFATKYGGTFITPMVAVVIVVRELRRGSSMRTTIRALVIDGAKSALFFWLAIAALSPHFIYRFSKYWSAMRYQAQWSRFGHPVRETLRSGAHWLDVLAEPSMITLELTVGFVVVVPLVIGGIFALARRDRRVIDDRELGLLVTALFGAIYTVFLMARFRDFSPRYILPPTPFLIIAALSALWRLVYVEGSRFRGRLAIAAVVAACLASAPTRVSALVDQRAHRLALDNDPKLEIGAWLERNVPEGTPMIADYYTYVPRRFEKAHLTWGLRDYEIKNVGPEMIIINALIQRMFRKELDPNNYRQGSETFLEIQGNYRAVIEGSFDGFRKVKAFDGAAGYVVYAKGSLADRLEAAQ